MIDNNNNNHNTTNYDYLKIMQFFFLYINKITFICIFVLFG